MVQILINAGAGVLETMMASRIFLIFLALTGLGIIVEYPVVRRVITWAAIICFAIFIVPFLSPADKLIVLAFLAWHEVMKFLDKREIDCHAARIARQDRLDGSHARRDAWWLEQNLDLDDNPDAVIPANE